ncbi:hypothetical protein KY290_000835 [Solanum tuberosum]|uniref:Uncharacterized protein n=1 Tax=Solanum tuberosum TaxID=4113 RepID=A0ABQ7WKF4_SOLTU|nr:hypothetical protein KY290_000835 [Solanum tuberosum]
MDSWKSLDTLGISATNFMDFPRISSLPKGRMHAQQLLLMFDQLVHLLQHVQIQEESNTTTGTVNDNTGGAVNFAGATHHMTFNKSLLTNIRHLPYPFLITLPNGYKVKVTEIGDGPSLKSPLEIGRARNGLLTSLSVHPASSCKSSCNPLNFSSDVSTSHAHTNTPIGTCAFYKNEEDFLHPNNLFILTTLHVYCLSNGQTD